MRRRFVALFDVAVGLGPAAVLLYPFGYQFAWAHLGPLAVVAGTVAGVTAGFGQFLADRDAVPLPVLDRSRDTALALVTVVALAVLLLVTLRRRPPAAAAWIAVLASGAGLGYAANRLVFGVLRPLPPAADPLGTDASH